ncbi:hypothetical protein F4779DRAFT_621367 [Xylariaceae sp. FL0662B]|nr:hypothetical protein F4779DRAFT_621367 [Xylariaceae sp. FL0662B]
MDPSHKLTTEVCRRELAADFDDDMVQDAMAIILFPTLHTAGVFLGPICHHYRSWKAQRLPNPLRSPDDECDDTPSDDLVRLYGLHSRLLFFIEDYLTKATATDPSREYFGLSSLSPYSQYLTYMGHPLSPRFSAANLTGPERQRLFRAFLRYELLCKMCCSDDLGDSSWYYKLSALWKYKGQTFRQVEAEAIACVQSYVVSLHKAIAVQCESYCMNIFTNDRLFPQLSCFGFDLATALLQAATAGKQGRDHVQMWFHDLCERKPVDLRTVTRDDCKDCILGFNPLRVEDTHYTEGPGMYKLLYPIGVSSSMQRYLYRRKAWAFLDDVRLHPVRVQRVCFTDVDWAGPERLHDLYDRPVDEHPHDAQIQLEYPTPPFLQGNRFVGLAPFWQ